MFLQGVVDFRGVHDPCTVGSPCIVEGDQGIFHDLSTFGRCLMCLLSGIRFPGPRSPYPGAQTRNVNPTYKQDSCTSSYTRPVGGNRDILSRWAGDRTLAWVTGYQYTDFCKQNIIIKIEIVGYLGPR